ncbi:MDR family MFS transporter [Nocardia sp. BMG111209]|uniref:MDR family MFS transporter n=1 Tax=Nocardia sp. BMG111209 TaxID=1160137 RepID=UPI00068F4528|nr:MDR family MFS transporter [Nocardia sp. BMG111209]
MTTPETTTATRTNRLDPAVLALAWVLIAGMMAPLLDSTIVNVAFRTLGRDLHAPLATVQWVSTGYLLALAMAVPIAAWSVRRFGAKTMWITALVLFLLGSISSGAAWNIQSLIGFRVLQGAGAGLMMPILQTLLFQAAGRERIGRLMALITLPALVGPILGPTLGGLIADNLGWRWLFYVNVPVCALAITMAVRKLPDSERQPRSRLDLTGLLLVSPGLAALVYGLSEVGTTGGFGHLSVLLPITIGVALLAVFTGYALSRRQAEPIIDLRLFGIRSFSASMALLFLTGFMTFGSMLLLPLFYQGLRGATALTAGLMLAPQGIGSLIARGAGSLTDRIGPRPVILAGIGSTVLGTLPFVVADRHTNAVLLGTALVVRGIGLSAVNIAVMVGANRDLRPDQIPHASSTTRIAQQVGGAFGAAVLAVVLQHLLGDPTVGIAAAYGHTFAWSAALTAVGILPALLLPGRSRGVGSSAVPHHRPVPLTTHGDKPPAPN